MRSLAGKLTLAFLLVGVLGVLLFALLVGQRTRTEFDRFLSDRDQSILTDALTDYYTDNEGWAGVRRFLAAPPLNFYARDILLLNADGVVELGNRGIALGRRVNPQDLNGSTALQVNQQTVGYVVWLPAGMGPGGPGGRRIPAPMEAAFWGRIIWAAVASGAITILLALLLGWWLARTLTAPVRELTSATQAMAAGDLNQRVQVHTQDEIGNLARSFNQMSADLARASQLRRQMTADLAHDLRTPLSILRGYLEGLKEEQLQGTPVLYTLMHDEVLHLQRLVEDLRVLSLADAGELSLNRRLVDPAALLERTGLLYVVAAEQQGIQLRVEAAETLPSILVDTDRITQVLNNLVSNALRHTSQGEIVLSAWAAQGHVYLRVHDTGSGIAREEIPHVFDRFYRGDKARQRTDDTSSGLGLAIAKAIVEAHGGTIQVESVVGESTTFTLVLPIPEQ
ncbi:MAG: HAMP domain-containing histidine kinase [Caldilineaceae bacterium]|nr:HAMP domain-containing histidine kinase [Caldilineaceae bacterium]